MTLEKAREWASRHDRIRGVFCPDAKAAVEVIQSLPDQWVDVEKVREVINGQLSVYTRGTVGHYIAEEITGNLKALITPKLEWPGSGDEPTIAQKEKVAPDQAVAKDVCNNESNSSETPKSSIKPEDVPANEPWLIEVDGQKAIGTRYKGDAVVPWSVAALDGSFASDYNDREASLIHKLVPESHALPEGMRLADHADIGRVIVSPKADSNGTHRIFGTENNRHGASQYFVRNSDLTFLERRNQMTNQNPDPIVVPGIVEQLLRAHYGLVFDLRAENKELKVKLAQATATSELASKNADSWFASREEYWGRAQAAEKKLSDAEDELSKQRNALAHANVQVEKAERELADAKKKLFKEDQQVESLLEQLADMCTDLMKLKKDVKEAMAGCEGSYVLMTEAFRKIRFLVASDETYVPQAPPAPEENLVLGGNLKLLAVHSGGRVILEDCNGEYIKITANKLKPLGEYLLAVHLFNEVGGNDDV